jgi:hypothetical protein
MSFHYLNTEMTIRHICDSILDSNTDVGVYIGFDLRIRVDKNNYEQRDIARGVHLLRVAGYMIGAVNDNFLFPHFTKDNEWEHISSHSSCWADSTMHYINNIVTDVMKNKLESKHCKRYEDDDLVFGEHDSHMSLGGFEIIKKSQWMNLEFKYNDHKKVLKY